MSRARRLAGRVRRRLLPPPSVAPTPAHVDPLVDHAALRSQGDVVELADQGYWVVLGYDAARTVIRDAERFSNAPYADIDTTLLSVSPPRHTAVRRAVGGLVAPPVNDRVLAIADATAQSLVGRPVDVVTGYARPLSRRIATAVMGFDEATARDLLDAASAADAQADPIAAQFAAIDAFGPRSRAHADLLQDAPDVLTRPEVDSFLRLLWIASTVTTEALVVSCILRLLHDAQTHSALRARPELVTAFVDEVTRLDPPAPVALRETVGPVELAGVTIPGGAAIRVALPAVNRDPSRFDDPEAFRLDRTPGRHLSFGAGAHACLGAALARRTVPLAVTTILRELPDLRPVDAELPAPSVYPPPRLVVTG